MELSQYIYTSKSDTSFIDTRHKRNIPASRFARGMQNLFYRAGKFITRREERKRHRKMCYLQEIYEKCRLHFIQERSNTDGRRAILQRSIVRHFSRETQTQGNICEYLIPYLEDNISQEECSKNLCEESYLYMYISQIDRQRR